MALRQYPGFAEADLAELAVLAENVVEEEFAAGTIVTRAGRVPSIHLVVEGSVGMGATSWGPRDLVGALEAMAGRHTSAPMIATTATRTLQLSAADFADILEDNFGLLSNVRRALARTVLAARRRRNALPPSRPQLAIANTGALGLVDKLLVLRHQLPFTSGRIHALAALAEATREVSWPAGAVIAHAGDPPAGSYLILEGAVRVRGAERVMGPGDAIGALEMLGDVTHAASAEALTPVRALECPAAAVLDLIEDHTDLALAMVASLAGELLDQPPGAEETVN
jgi:CRP-like cAMP-binding protein